MGGPWNVARLQRRSIAWRKACCRMSPRLGRLRVPAGRWVNSHGSVWSRRATIRCRCEEVPREAQRADDSAAGTAASRRIRSSSPSPLPALTGAAYTRLVERNTVGLDELEQRLALLRLSPGLYEEPRQQADGENALLDHHDAARDPLVGKRVDRPNRLAVSVVGVEHHHPDQHAGSHEQRVLERVERLARQGSLVERRQGARRRG